MMTAKKKYYIYRNLHKNCFSIRYGGKVIGHCKSFLSVDGARFKVNPKGRERVLKEKAKNVHAFVVLDNEPIKDIEFTSVSKDNLEEVYYNPYKSDSFIIKNSGYRDGEPISMTNGVVLGFDNKVFLCEVD